MCACTAFQPCSHASLLPACLQPSSSTPPHLHTHPHSQHCLAFFSLHISRTFFFFSVSHGLCMAVVQWMALLYMCVCVLQCCSSCVVMLPSCHCASPCLPVCLLHALSSCPSSLHACLFHDIILTCCLHPLLLPCLLCVPALPSSRALMLHCCLRVFSH
jgi:hypothetical protein